MRVETNLTRSSKDNEFLWNCSLCSKREIERWEAFPNNNPYFYRLSILQSFYIQFSCAHKKRNSHQIPDNKDDIFVCCAQYFNKYEIEVPSIIDWIIFSVDYSQRNGHRWNFSCPLDRNLGVSLQKRSSSIADMSQTILLFSPTPSIPIYKILYG